MTATAAPTATKPGTTRLSEAARHLAVPKGITSTGWPSVREKCREFGIVFRPWQPGVGRVILAKRDDGKYASTIGGTGLSIPRQVGKTFLVGAIIFALCLLCPNLTVIWTAHRLRTANETFRKMQAFARRRRIWPHVEKIVLGSGEEEIRFLNGSRILFGARERGFGLGFDEIDVLIFDEAQRLTEKALDDMIPATNQSRQSTGALVLFMGTPPRPTDPGEVFTRMRDEALAGDEDTAWVEFGADPGFKPTPPPAPMGRHDWDQVAKANPSYPADTPREAILRMRKKLGPESFLREGLGIWDDPGATEIFGPGSWTLCRVEDEPPAEGLALGFAVSIERAWASIGAAALRGDTRVLGAVLRIRSLDKAVAECARIAKERGCAVAVDGRGPAASLISSLEDAGVEVLTASTADYCGACEAVYDAVTQTAAALRADPDGERLIGHPGHDAIDAAVAGAAWRAIGDRRAWGRKTSTADVSMLEATTLADWNLRSAVPEPNIF